jgi:hypothetical protein
MTFNSQRKFMLGGVAVLALTVFAGSAQSASAATIVMQGAQSVTTFGNAGLGEYQDGPNRLAANRMIDQGGLTTRYVNGQDQAAYLAQTPVHTDSTTQEWFSRTGRFSADRSASGLNFIEFDLGADYDLRNIVLWNEDFAGIENFSVLTSTSANRNDFNVVFNPLNGSSTFKADDVDAQPTLNLAGVRNTRANIEGPQNIKLSDTGITARYVNLFIQSVYKNELDNRDLPDFGAFQAGLGPLASIGEFAVGRNIKPDDTVPTPALLPGLIGLGATAWRKRRQLATK